MFAGHAVEARNEIGRIYWARLKQVRLEEGAEWGEYEAEER